ncbi:T9SS type A sorting domain-containing protein [Arsenicibacter rosenii]|uniref:Secretion system C-terminal sorting domain-containing protein n=1 Tax=Arsenicibacter rosenii TaxID=1750698 RepID=A0A1S2VLK4_9BACT|nr:T9SS type A sorting domain-containing protein [Arsenicibacter rosenii]OIN59290.1 hypothetical protein BLX24_09900 [Arsenicibacter rosenii]
MNKILSRSDWTANATWFNWQCHWTSINHQSGDGNQFELFRKGEWLIKERSGYTNDGIGYTSEFHNTLGLQNDVPANMQWFEAATSQRGGQWTNGMGAGDPSVISSYATDYVYATGDATNLYNRANSATDMLYAVRSIVWLKPDHVIVYDRARSKTANRFKRFFLQFTGPPQVSGKNVAVNTPGGQKVYLTSLLPAAGVLTSSVSEVLNSLAELETTTHELKIEDRSNPANIRFLNVIQGADGTVAQDASVLVQSTAGDAFEGAVVKNTAVLFPNVWGNGFTTTTYTIPSVVTMQLITGLTPNTGYAVASVNSGATTTVTITPGGSLMTDGGGVLRIAGAAGREATNADLTLTVMAMPNPAQDEVTVQYTMPKAGPVTVDIIDVPGRKAAVLTALPMQEAGRHTLQAPTRQLSKGMYLIRVQTADQQATYRLLVH